MDVAVENGKRKGKEQIRIGTKVLLSVNGMKEFSRRKVSPKRFLVADGIERFGIEMKNYNPAILQKLILQQYVSTIQINTENVAIDRRNILDLSKLITYSMLYLKFDLNVWDLICESDIVKIWNRTHPKYPIDQKTEGSSPHIQNHLKNHKEEVQVMREFLVSSTRQGIRKGVVREDMALYEGMMEKFLDNLRPLVWFLLTTRKNTTEIIPILNTLIDTLITSITRTYISEYISLLVLELVSFLQVKPFAKKLRSSRRKFESPESTYISVLYQIHPIRSVAGEKTRLSIIVCDQETANRELGTKIVSRANAELNPKTLKEFYDSHALKDTEVFSLGLYYLSFLKEECNRLGISFNAFVTNSLSGNTFIHLRFAF